MKKTLTLLLATFSMVGFQNCGDTAFQASDKGLAKASESYLDPEYFAENNLTDDEHGIEGSAVYTIEQVQEDCDNEEQHSQQQVGSAVIDFVQDVNIVNDVDVNQTVNNHNTQTTNITNNNHGSTTITADTNESMDPSGGSAVNDESRTYIPPGPALSMVKHYYYKCEITLRGQRGWMWKVERLYDQQRDCRQALRTVRANNPNATVVSIKGVNQGYHKDNTDTPYHWKCRFTLRGQRGAIFYTERHMKFDDNCQAATEAVRRNNPNATLLNRKEIFRGFHLKQNNERFHYKCEFKLTGQRGYEWFVERYTAQNDQCRTAKLAVEMNNPNAQIELLKLNNRSSAEIFVGYSDGPSEAQ